MSPHGGFPVPAGASNGLVSSRRSQNSNDFSELDVQLLAQLRAACVLAEPARTLALGRAVLGWFPERLHRAWRGESPRTPCRLVDFSRRQRAALAQLGLNLTELRQSVLFVRAHELLPPELRAALSRGAQVQLGCVTDDARLVELAVQTRDQRWGAAELESRIRAELQPGTALAARRGRPALPQLLKTVGKVQRSAQHLTRTRQSIPSLPDASRVEALERLQRVMGQLQAVADALAAA